MAGYTRQSTFADGDTITAALFNNEFNQLLNAFGNTSGHKHDGTANEGPVIGLIGDAGETSPNNKVLIDTTNNYIEFYVEVSSAPVQQLYIADGAIIPVTDSDIDLGTTSLRFKDTYTDTITTTGNATIGGNLTVTGNATISGNLTFGDADTDSINLAAEIDSHIVPNTDGTYDLGTTTKEWRNLYIDGTANIDSLVADTADINGGTIDGATIATSDITVGAGKTLNVSAGTLTLADDQISGDKVEGGTIAATTITDLTFGSLNDGTITVTAFVDEDNMVSNSATLIPTQQSVKAYVDSQVTAQDLDITTDSGTIAIDLDSETLTVTGGTGLDSSATGNAVTLAIDSTVATLTGSQTLTNKTLTSPDINTPDIDGGTIDATTIGGATPAAGSFTTLSSSGGITGTLQTAAQTNITSVGTLSSLSVGSTLTIDNTASSSFGTIEISGTSGAYIDLKSPSSDDFDLRIITSGTGGQINAAAGTLALQIAGSSILSTSSSGVAVTGTLSATGDITGTLATAAQPNITSVGTLTTLTVDDITINASSISDAGDLTIDVGGDLNFDADGGDIILKDGGTSFGKFVQNSSNFHVVATVQDKDIKFFGNDGGSSVTALTLDMSDAGKAIFNAGATFGSGIDVTGTVTADGLTVDGQTQLTRPSTEGLTLTLDSAGNAARSLEVSSFTNSVAGAGWDFNASGSTGAVQISTAGVKRIFAQNNGDISFYEDTGTSAALFWDASAESLGIGETSPQNPLHVRSDSASGENYAIQIDNNNTTAGSQIGMLFRSRVGGTNTDFSIRGIANGSDDMDLTFNSDGGSERLRITKDGLVGIGTDSPERPLHIASATPYIVFDETDASQKFSMGSGGGKFFLYDETDSAQRLTVDTSGNVGIGTTGPASPLHVKVGTNQNLEVDSNGSELRLSAVNDARSTNPAIRFQAESYKFYGAGGVGPRATIDSSGNLIVGGTTAQQTSAVTLTAGGSIVNDGFIRPATDATYDIGSSSKRYKDLYLSGTAYTNGITTTGNLVIGTEDNNSALLEISGAATGSTEGGEIRLDTAADHDGTYEFYRIDVNQDDFRIGRQGNTDFYIFQDGKVKVENVFEVGGVSNLSSVDASAGISSTALMNVKADGTNDTVINVGLNTASNHYSYIDLIGDSTYTDYGLRIIRNNGGANTSSGIHHRGTGELFFRTDDAADMKFETNAEEAMRIDSSGNVGIGTSNPTAKFEVQDANSVSLKFGDLASYPNNVTPCFIGTGTSALAGVNGDLVLVPRTSDAGKIIFATGNGGAATEKMRIDASGHVVIQDDAVYTTNAPTYRGSLILAGASGATSFGGIEFHTNAGGGAGYGTKIAASDAEQTFLRRNNATGWSESMRINSTGDVLIGTTNTDPTFNRSDGICLSSQDAIFCRGGASWDLGRNSNSGAHIAFYTDNGSARVSAGNISSSGSTTSFNTSSDARLKDVTGEARGLEVINELNPVSYNWKEDGKADEGFIAQEVLDIVPNAVSGSEEEMYTMDYSKLVVHLVKAVKEQQTQIEALQSEINLLKGE